MTDMLANRVLNKHAMTAEPIQAGEHLVVDLNHLSTWPLSFLSERIRWSLSDEEVMSLQLALMKSFSLREITRERALPRFVGGMVKDIRAIKDGSDDTRVVITFDDEQELILWTHKKKR